MPRMTIELDSDDDFLIHVGNGLEPSTYFSILINGEDKSECFKKAIDFLSTVTTSSKYDSGKAKGEFYVEHTITDIQEKMGVRDTSGRSGGNCTIKYQLHHNTEYDLVL